MLLLIGLDEDLNVDFQPGMLVHPENWITNRPISNEAQVRLGIIEGNLF